MRNAFSGKDFPAKLEFLRHFEAWTAERQKLGETLVVCGEGDAITPPECSREMAAAIPGARLEWLPECGHMLTMEKPAPLNALLLAWLGALEHISAPGSSG